ncbi:MAG: sigma-70 family RNA polymerase sigma factor [Ruminococcus sp.]|nr:sigma-70 family RNA polymerase sigma factor [Ruminococcus sp.]
MDDKMLRNLFNRIGNKDKNAFSIVYNDLKVPVFTVIFRIVNSKEVAEDITQDVFVKLFVSPPDLSVKKLRAWIFTVSRNSAIDYLRKNKVLHNEEITLSAHNVENEVLNRLDIEQAFQTLDTTEREIVTLHLNAGLSFKQIASITQLSLPSTYRRYKKALNKLKVILSGGVL